jgi:DNA ligase-1
MQSNFKEIIHTCENTTGSGSKKIIQEVLAKSDPIAQRLIYEALNSYRVFGIKKWNEPVHQHTTSVNAYDLFFDTLDKLANREYTGNNAVEMVEFALSHFSKSEAKYIERVLDKDLKCGFSADTFNKVFKNAIPVFDCMLADKPDADDDEWFDKYINFKDGIYADQKLDGQRIIAVVKKHEIVYYSREGKIAFQWNGIFDQDLYKIHLHIGHDFVLDGEAYASNFTETMNAKKKDNAAAKANLNFNAFFFMPLEDWLNQSTKITMGLNIDHLPKILKHSNVTKIVMPKGRKVTDYTDMMNFCNESIDVDKVEGLILKNMNAVYEWDRKRSWTKVKRFYDIDAKIVGMYKGKAKSRFEHTFGGFNCIGFLEDGTRVEFNCGGGFTDAMRDDIWNNPDKYINKTGVFKYQEVSKGKNKEFASLRFNTFVHLRDDKLIEI